MLGFRLSDRFVIARRIADSPKQSTQKKEWIATNRFSIPAMTNLSQIATNRYAIPAMTMSVARQ
ncbi:hypothetical protein [Helicobacter sp. MIT 01-3238]|uniref:hypothetical protein n=1 Tax=Helicobacter sp. MIT 01-3238 TaxID=398627 RepID=UPI0011C062D7|nr:hypothetical protein [Helicobacter sp. MIT 01-3238]